MITRKSLLWACLALPTYLFAQAWTFTPSAYPLVCTNAAEVGQWTMDYATATNRAASEHKRLYLFIVGSTWCPDCNGLETQVISKPAFSTFMAESDAYWVWLDFPKRTVTNVTAGAWLCHTNTGFFSLAESENLLARNRQLEAAYAVFKKYRSATTINMPTLLVLKPDGSYQGEVTHYRQLTNVTAEAFISKIGRVWNDDAWDVQDNRVPGKSDDTAASATALTNLLVEVTRQPHTLSATDAADWYTFTAEPGRTYTLSAEGRLLGGQAALPAGQVSVELFTETNAAAQPVAAASGMLGETQTVAWTLNQARPQTCFVKVSGAFVESAGYDFAYSQFTAADPADVRFEQAEVRIAETATSVTLNVVLASLSAADGGVRVFVTTRAPAEPVPFGTATPAQDYVAVISNEVVWTRDEALQQLPKQVTIPLVQDLHPVWEGDERFSVVLENGLNSAVAPDGRLAAVVLTESSKRVAGSVGFVAQGAAQAPFERARKPGVAVREGSDVVLWVDRAGGADGEVSATVETVGGTALPGVHFMPQTVNVAWASGETGPRPVTLATLATGAYEADRVFTARITGSTAAGVTPGAGSVTVTVRDQLVAQGLNGAAAGALKYSSAGAAAWFVGAAGELRCEPVQPGKGTTLKTAVTGPGRLRFDWGFLPAVQAESRLVIKVGAETRTFRAADADKGSELFYVTKAGAQPVTWQFSAAGGEPSAVAVSNLVWQPLQKASSPVPAQNFICTDSPGMLMWAPVAAADEYRVYVGDSKSKLERLSPEETVTACQIDPCLECILIDEMKHYWRVDSVMRLPGGGEVVVRGDVWPFSIKSWDGPFTQLPSFDVTAGLQVTAAGAYRLVAGVQYALGPFSMFYDCGCGDEEEVEDSDPLTYALTGKLPAGLAMKDLNGATHFVGVPSKPGDYALWVQSHATVDGERVIGSTFPVAFSVAPLQRAAGQFSGWVSNAADPWKNGSVALAVGPSGKLAAKVQVGGQTYSFSKPGYDAETNGTVYVRLEAQAAKTGAGAGLTNVLALAVSMASGEATGTLTLPGVASASGVKLFRDNWKEPEMAGVAAACAGYYTVALPVAAATEHAPLGSGYLTMTVAATGAVRLSGVLADGKSWSSSATLLASEEVEDAGAAGVRTNTVLRVPVYAAQAAYRGAGGLCGLLRLVPDDAAGALCVAADPEMPLRWWNADGRSVYGYDPQAEVQGFDAALDACGGFYDTVMNLQTWYLGQTLAFGAFGGETPAPGGFGGQDDTVSGYTLVNETPEGLQVTVLPQALTAPRKALALEEGGAIDFDRSVNPCGLTLAYARATGLLSGGFTLYYQSATPGAAYKTKTCAYKGVLTPARVMAGPWLRAEGQGFYLIPDKGAATTNGRPRAYPFNWSYRLLLLSADPL